MKHILFVAALAAALPAHAQVFKCQEGGKTVFSDRPCHAEAKPLDVKPAAGAYDPAAAAVLEQQTARRLEAQAAAQKYRDKAEERREMARAKEAAEPDECARLRQQHADAKRWSKEFHHPENIRREQEKAKKAASDSFFKCGPGERVSVFDQ
ncbi:hypothetical protein CJ010_00715 [Azoarcus sp. DD4]|nr:hypothetical protein CJ010_00715 [Azoarcus sp. DD4]